MGQQMTRKVGVVGVGAMGRALLHRIRLTGAAVQAFDVAEDAMQAARELGAQTVTSPAAAARDVEYVHICVRTDEQELEAVLGPDGVLSGASEGTVMILHGTVVPETTKAIAEAALQRGIALMDATIMAVPPRLHAGEAIFLTGGATEVASKARPYLESLGRKVHHFGPLGSGNVAKIAKNLVSALDRMVMVEAVWIAEAGGIAPEIFLKMMHEDYLPLAFDWERVFEIENGHATPRPATSLLSKDIQHAVEFAAAHGIEAPIARDGAKTAARWMEFWANEAKKRSA